MIAVWLVSGANIFQSISKTRKLRISKAVQDRTRQVLTKTQMENSKLEMKVIIEKF